MIYLLLLLNFLSCASPMESLRSFRFRWQDLLGEEVCECSTSLETGVESAETLQVPLHVPEKCSSEIMDFTKEVVVGEV